MATLDNPTSTRHLFVIDNNSKIQFLVDSGADLSVYPRTKVPGPLKRTKFDLAAANGTIIPTYGSTALTLNLGLRRDLVWNFVIADISKPIIGADFISHYGLLIDLQNSQLIDVATGITTRGKAISSNIPNIKIITLPDNSIFKNLLNNYPHLTCPDGHIRKIKHNIKHHILTTPGPTVFSKPRRLPPEKLSIAKKQFEAMLQLGIARPSSSCWASPLHLVPKKND